MKSVYFSVIMYVLIAFMQALLFCIVNIFNSCTNLLTPVHKCIEQRTPLLFKCTFFSNEMKKKKKTGA